MSTIKEALARKNEQNPQFDYLWRVELPALNLSTGDMLAGGLGFASGAVGGSLGGLASSASSLISQAQGIYNQVAGTGIIGSNTFDINHRVYSISTPFTSFEVEKAVNGPGFKFEAGHNEMGQMTLTVDEMEDGKTLEYFDKWMNMIKSSDGYSYNPPAIYKRDIRYVKMSASKLDLHFTLYKGFFPVEMSASESSYDGTGILQYTVTLAGDSARHVTIPEAQVKAMINAEEQAILRQSSGGSGWRIGGIDTQRVSGILDNVLNAFGL